MDEGDIRLLLRELQAVIHVAERADHHHAGAGRDHLVHDARRIRPFRHVFDDDGFHLVAERFLDRRTAVVQFLRPADIADRRWIDEADLELVGGGTAGGAKGDGERQRQSRGEVLTFRHQRFLSHCIEVIRS